MNMIDFKQSGQVAIVTLSRPEVHNAFNLAGIETLTKIFTEISGGARVVVLRSTGKTFSAGADLNWMKQALHASYEENLQDAGKLAAMFRAIRRCPKPVIARIQGNVFGGGTGLIACSDIAVSVASAKFSFSEVKIGLIPATIGPYVLEKTGMAPLSRYMLTGEAFDGAQAKRIGLISEVFADEAEMDRWIDATVLTFRKNAPNAVSLTKKFLRDINGKSPESLEAMNAREIATVRVSPEGQEGLRAFLAKETPVWARDVS